MRTTASTAGERRGGEKLQHQDSAGGNGSTQGRAIVRPHPYPAAAKSHDTLIGDEGIALSPQNARATSYY